MKPSFHSLTRMLATVAVGATCVLAIPQAAQADPYRVRPSNSRFVITLGNGYAGRGYYYGPAGLPYYSYAPGVRYYRERSLVPRQYWGSDPWRGGPRQVMGRGSLDASVQAALARRGYYHGPIDGDIGRGSRAAIARFQADHGMTPTGSINSRLLSALGLY